MPGWFSLIRRRSPGAILCFHGMTGPEVPADGTSHLSLDAFRAIVALAREFGDLVPLRELVARRHAGRSTKGLIAVTMDDAYASLLTVAGDVVGREAVPLTIFVVADAAASGMTYWWDRVDHVFARVSAGRWRLFEDACGVPDTYRWGQPPEYGPLRPLRQWVLAAHAGRWPPALEPALRALEEEIGSRTGQRAMTFDELECLRRLPAVDLGVHTVSHPVLPLLSDADVRREIAGAHDALRARMDNVLPILAVPFGLFDARTVQLARDCGMSASLTLAARTFGGRPQADHLPRFCISSRENTTWLRLGLAGLMDWERWWPARRDRYPDLPSPAT